MSNPDQFNTFTAIDLVPVTPNDGADLVRYARGLRIGGAGTLRITTLSGNERNTSVTAGEVLLVAARRVHATGTTATSIEAMI